MRKSTRDSPEKEQDRYLALCDAWREKYLKLDRLELKERFRLEDDGEAHYITYFNQRYRLDQRTGMITLEEEPQRELAFNTVMTIYHLFLLFKTRSAGSWKFCTLPGGKAGRALRRGI